MDMTKFSIISFLFVFFANIVLCEQLIPCPANNQKCLINLLENAKSNIETTVNELGVENTNELDISNVVIDEDEVLHLNVTKGVLKGIDTCVYDDVKIDLDNYNGYATVLCNFVSTGTYNAIIRKPKTIGVLIKTPLICNGPHYKITFQNINLRYNFDFKIVKDEEDRIAYFKFNSGDVVYSVTNEGHKVVYGLTGVHSGNEDVSDMVNKALNKNWKPASTIVVEHFFKAIIEKLVQRKLKYFSMVPVKKLLTDNFEKYVDQVFFNDEPKIDNGTCSINDVDCHLELIKETKTMIAKGVPELEIPKLNKLILKNLTVNLPDLMEFTLVVGSVTGSDKCVVKSARFDLGLNKFFIKQYCDLLVKGTYTALLYANATLSVFGGQSIQAHGNTEVKLRKIPLDASYDLTIDKKNGEKYFTFGSAKITYDYTEDGHSISFKLDGVRLGSLDISDFAMNILNDNWQYFAPDFGPTFVLAVNGLINDPLLKYLSSYPIKQYIN